MFHLFNQTESDMPNVCFPLANTCNKISKLVSVRSKVKGEVNGWQEITKSYGRADILPHIKIVLSRSPTLGLSRASSLSALTLLPSSMIYPPEKQQKLPSQPLRVTPSVLCLPICKCQLISQARPPSWTPNAAKCSFLCSPSAKKHINWDEERA